MMLVGILWAVLAPLSLPLIAGLITLFIRRLARPGQAVPADAVRPPIPAWEIYILSLTAVVICVGAIWVFDRYRFTDACNEMLDEQVNAHLGGKMVEGIYLNDSTANSFGMRYLQEEGFRWMEAADYRQLGRFVRYERGADKSITTTSIDTPTAQFEVRSDFLRPDDYTSFTVTRILERQSQKELANAALGNFNGGRMRWLLGVYGTASCNAPGSAEWSHAYHLAKEVFGK
jgi:hypothetical protein